MSEIGLALVVLLSSASNVLLELTKLDREETPQLRNRLQYLPSEWEQETPIQGPIPLVTVWAPTMYDFRRAWTKDDLSSFTEKKKSKKDETIYPRAFVPITYPDQYHTIGNGASRYRRQPALNGYNPYLFQTYDGSLYQVPNPYQTYGGYSNQVPNPYQTYGGYSNQVPNPYQTYGGYSNQVPNPYQTYGGSPYQVPNPYGNGYVLTYPSRNGKMIRTTTMYTTSITLVKTIQERRVVEIIDVETNEKNVFETWDSTSTEQIEESTISDQCATTYGGVEAKQTVVKVEKITTDEERIVVTTEPLVKAPRCSTISRPSLTNTTVVLTNSTKVATESVTPGSVVMDIFTSADHLIANTVMNQAPTYKRITTKNSNVLSTADLQNSPSYYAADIYGNCTFVHAGQSPRYVTTTVSNDVTMTPLDFLPYVYPFGRPKVR